MKSVCIWVMWGDVTPQACFFTRFFENLPRWVVWTHGRWKQNCTSTLEVSGALESHQSKSHKNMRKRYQKVVDSNSSNRMKKIEESSIDLRCGILHVSGVHKMCYLGCFWSKGLQPLMCYASLRWKSLWRPLAALLTSSVVPGAWVLCGGCSLRYSNCFARGLAFLVIWPAANLLGAGSNWWWIFGSALDLSGLAALFLEPWAGWSRSHLEFKGFCWFHLRGFTTCHFGRHGRWQGLRRRVMVQSASMGWKPTDLQGFQEGNVLVDAVVGSARDEEV